MNFHNEIEEIKASFLSIPRLHTMLLCLYNTSSQAKLLETDEADEVFNDAEIKQTPSLTFSSGSI